MSVKPSKFDQKRPSSSMHRSTRQSVGLIQQSYEYLVCSHNTIRFEKQLLDLLKITFVSQPKTICENPSKQQNSISQFQLNGQISSESPSMVCQVSEAKLYVTKNNVKHIFPLNQKENLNNEQNKCLQFIMIEVGVDQDIVINSYGLTQNKGKKLHIITQQSYKQNNNDCEENIQKVCPNQLIEQALKVRAKKLTASTSKRKLVFAENIEQNSSCKTKVLNIRKTTQSPDPKNMLAKSSKCLHKFSDLQMKNSIKKTNISLAFYDDKKQASKNANNISIRGVDYKKSVQKKTSRSVSKNINEGISKNKKMANQNSKKSGNSLMNNSYVNNKQNVHNKLDSRKGSKNNIITGGKQNQKKFIRQNPSTNKLNKFNPVISHKTDKNTQLNLCSPITKNMAQQQQDDSQISSLSFYTAQKQPQTQQLTQTTQKSICTQHKITELPPSQRKLHLNKSSKFTKFQHDHSNKKQSVTRKKQTEDAKIKSKPFNKSSVSNTSKNFSKNISQTKIAQVSRALVQKKKK